MYLAVSLTAFCENPIKPGTGKELAGLYAQGKKINFYSSVDNYCNNCIQISFAGTKYYCVANWDGIPSEVEVIGGNYGNFGSALNTGFVSDSISTQYDTKGNSGFHKGKWKSPK